MTESRLVRGNERIIDWMIGLSGCSKLQRILVAGARSVELMFELRRYGYIHAAGAANCGRPAGQYDVALVDWRQRTLRTLERTLDWLVDFLCPKAVLVLWVGAQKPAVIQELRSTLERRGFVVEAVTVREDGATFSARRFQQNPLSKAA